MIATSHKLRSEVYAKAKYINIQSHKFIKPLKKTEQIVLVTVITTMQTT